MSSSVNTITVTDTTGITVTTVGEQGLSGPAAVFGKSFKTYTASSTDDGAGIIYDHSNTRWLSTMDSDASSLAFKVQKLTFSSGATVTAILDEDNMSSNSATALATQQSIKAYIDAEVTAQDLDFQADSGGALNIDLDSETLTLTGGTGIDTAGSSNTVTFSLDLNELTTETSIADDDFIAMVDATDNASGKITFENLEDAIFSSVSGDIAIAEDGTATIQANSVALSTDTTGDYVASISAGEGIDVSGSGEGASVTVSAEDATSSNKGIASFDSTDFSVSSGAVTLQAERIQDIVGAMISSNTESGIAVTYEDGDGTLDFDVGDFTITLGGDLTGNVTITNLANGTLTATIAANSVALGTDTTGDYVASVSASNAGIDISGSGEGATPTFGLNTEYVQDLVGDMISSNTESGIAVTYDDTNGKLDFNVADPVITLSGDVTGSGTLSNLGDLTISTTIANNSVALGTDTTGNYVATISAGEGIDVSGSGSESAGVTISAEDATSSNKGIASFDATDFTVSSGDVTINAERIQDIVGAMVSSNTETNITVSYEDSDGTLDFVIADATDSTKGVASFTSDFSVSSGAVSLADEAIQDIVGAMFSSNTETGITATYQDADGTIDLVIPNSNFALTGDVTGTATQTAKGDVSITTTIAANSVALGTDTTGNYVSAISGTTNEIEVSGSGSETATVTIGLPDNVTIGGNLTVTGDMTINGSTTTVSTTNMVVEDNLIELNTGASSNANDSGIVIERGSTGDNAIFIWDESADKFVVGTTTATGSSTGNLTVTTGTLVANIEGAVTGNASTATALATARNIHGVSFDGTANIDLSEVIQDTVGAMFSSNTETGITVTYQDSDGTIDVVLDSVANSSLANSSITISDGSNTSDVALGGTLTIQGTSNEVEVAESSGTVTVGIPAAAQITTSLGIGGGSTNGVQISQGAIAIKNGGTQSYIDFYCESNNAHRARLQAPAHSAFSGNITLTLPATTDTLIARTTTDTLTNKSIDADNNTLSNIEVDNLKSSALDTDLSSVSSNDDTLASAKAIKAYVDSVASTNEAIQDVVGAMFSSNTETGITATYQDSDGTIDLVVGSVANSALANSTITVSDGSNTTGVALGGTITFAAGEGIDVGESSGTVTFSGEDATTSNKGVASFSSDDFSVSSGSVTVKAGGITNAQLAGSIANAKLSNSSVTVSDGSNTSPIALGGTLTFAATSNETTVAEDAGTVTIGLPADVTISNDLTVSGNLVVTGNTTQTGSLLSNSNFQALSQNNSGNTTDFGFYGKYVESSTTKYAGLFYDASTDNTFRLFCDTQTQPSTTVNTGATGYAAGNLVIGALTTTGITIGSTAVTSTAAELNILDGVTSTATELNILDGVTSTTAELNILDGVTSTATELNLLDGSSANTVVNSKAVIYGSSGELAGTLSTAAQTNITSLGTLTTLTVDDITINGSTISDSGDITLDIGGDIILDADGGNITFKDGGTAIGDFSNSSSDFVIEAKVQDKDILFKGDDGGSGITALTLDMSEAGHATFNSKVTVGTNAVGTLTTDNDGSFDMSASNNFKCTPSGNFTLTFTNIVSQSGNILLVNSGGHTVSAHSNSKVDANLLATVSTAGTYLLSYFSDGTDVFLTNSAAYT